MKEFLPNPFFSNDFCGKKQSAAKFWGKKFMKGKRNCKKILRSNGGGQPPGKNSSHILLSWASGMVIPKLICSREDPNWEPLGPSFVRSEFVF